MQTPTTFRETIKHAAMSIAVGAVISFLTVLFQASISWLHNVQPEIPGAVVGIVKYLHSIRTHYLG